MLGSVNSSGKDDCFHIIIIKSGKKGNPSCHLVKRRLCAKQLGNKPDEDAGEDGVGDCEPKTDCTQGTQVTEDLEFVGKAD